MRIQLLAELIERLFKASESPKTSAEEPGILMIISCLIKRAFYISDGERILSTMFQEHIIQKMVANMISQGEFTSLRLYQPILVEMLEFWSMLQENEDLANAFKSIASNSTLMTELQRNMKTFETFLDTGDRGVSKSHGLKKLRLIEILEMAIKMKRTAYEIAFVSSRLPEILLVPCSLVPAFD